MLGVSDLDVNRLNNVHFDTFAWFMVCVTFCVL